MERLSAACNPLAIFGAATLVSWRKVEFFVVRYKKIAFPSRPCGGPYDASRVCVVARAYQPHSCIRVSFPRSLLLSRPCTQHRVTTDFYAIKDKKKYIFLRESPSRKIGFSSIGTERARVPISLLRAPHVSPIGSSLVITVTASTLLLPRYLQQFAIFFPPCAVKHAACAITITTRRPSRIVKRQLINEARALAAARVFFSSAVFGVRRESTERARETSVPPRFTLRLFLSCCLLAVFDRFENQCATRSTATHEEKSLRVPLHASYRRFVAYLQISFC